MTKIIDDISDAFTELQDGMTILSGGFGLCGIPENSIDHIAKLGTKNLTVVSNNCGIDEEGLGKLLKNHQISKIIASYVGENKEFERQFIAKEIEVVLTPQGTLAEKLRAGGAGIPAFYTATGAGTLVAEGKETRTFNGKNYILEEAITGDYAIIKAHKADKIGNLVFNKTAMNFNPVCAKAARITIAEVEEIVEVGELDPNFIHLPGIYVNYIYRGKFKKTIERIRTRD